MMSLGELLHTRAGDRSGLACGRWEKKNCPCRRGERHEGQEATSLRIKRVSGLKHTDRTSSGLQVHMHVPLIQANTQRHEFNRQKCIPHRLAPFNYIPRRHHLASITLLCYKVVKAGLIKPLQNVSLGTFQGKIEVIPLTGTLIFVKRTQTLIQICCETNITSDWLTHSKLLCFLLLLWHFNFTT